MKKTFLAYSISALFSLTIVTGSDAQTSNAGSVPKLSSSEEYTSFNEEARSRSGTPVLLNEVNTKAQRNFVRDYKHISAATWFKLEDGFVVYFIDKDVNTRVAYDKKGNYLWTIRDYTENKLAFEIRDLVKSKYYDLSIYHIDEVKSNDGIVYMIKLEGKTTWKIIKVSGGEMTVVNDYVKN